MGETRPAFRVVDFSTHISGPLASYLLREFGAEVIKVEAPRHGDGLRPLKPDIGGAGKYHAGLNAGARSVVMDFRSPQWQPMVRALAASADVVIVGGRPEAARKRGIDFATIREASPRVVYCAITGFGEDGPWRGNAAHGLNPDAWAGLVPIRHDSGHPAPPAEFLSHGTPLAGVFAALGIMAALFRRNEGGTQGKVGAHYVSTSLWQSALWWNWRELNLQLNLGERRASYDELGPRYATYETADGRALIVCPIEQKFWTAFCAAAGLPGEMAARGAWETAHVDYGYDGEREAIAARIATRPLAEWTEVLTRADIPFAPVLTATEAVTSDHARALHVTRGFAMAGEQVSVMAAPVRIGDEPGAVAPPPMEAPPLLGADTEAVLAELGLTTDMPA